MSGVIAMRVLYQTLEIVPAKWHEHLFFNLLNFHFFKNSEKIGFLSFGRNWLLTSLIVIPYILTLEVVHSKGKRFFVKSEKRVVGIFVLREKPETLNIDSLAVAPEYRKSGIGTYILTYASKLANRMNKKELELSVLKTNIPALQLYEKRGFIKKEEKKWSFILRKKLKPVDVTTSA